MKSRNRVNHGLQDGAKTRSHPKGLAQHRVSGETPNLKGAKARLWVVGKRTDNQHTVGGDPLETWGSRGWNSTDVGEDDTQSLGVHSDPGRPSVLRDADSKAAARKGRAIPTGATSAVGPGAIRGQWDQGVRWGHSSNDAPGNRGRAKGPWATKDGVEKIRMMTLRGNGPERQATRPTTDGEPPTRGEDAERPLGVPGAVGEEYP
jgi:hypothetical protein